MPRFSLLLSRKNRLGEPHFIRTPGEVYKTRYYSAVKRFSEEIASYYKRTGSEQAMRLFCFFPKTLPDKLDLSYENALKISGGDEKYSYINQASSLIAQGFLASERNYPKKGYPAYISEIHVNELKVTSHIEEAHSLMIESPSLLVRGSAAICLVYTGIKNDEITALLSHLGEQSLNNVVWAWDEDFSLMARKAWFFASDEETLVTTNLFPTLDYTSREKDGPEIRHYSQSEVLP
jgi:hypothetical protein